MELTNKQIEKIRDERYSMKETQLKVMNMVRPSEKDHLCERGTLQKLHSMQNTQGLFGGEGGPYKKYEELLKKYRNDYFFSGSSLKRKDDVNYIEKRQSGLVAE